MSLGEHVGTRPARNVLGRYCSGVLMQVPAGSDSSGPMAPPCLHHARMHACCMHACMLLIMHTRAANLWRWAKQEGQRLGSTRVRGGLHSSTAYGCTTSMKRRSPVKPCRMGAAWRGGVTCRRINEDTLRSMKGHILAGLSKNKSMLLQHTPVAYSDFHAACTRVCMILKRFVGRHHTALVPVHGRSYSCALVRRKISPRTRAHAPMWPCQQLRSSSSSSSSSRHRGWASDSVTVAVWDRWGHGERR